MILVSSYLNFFICTFSEGSSGTNGRQGLGTKGIISLYWTSGEAILQILRLRIQSKFFFFFLKQSKLL